MNLCYMYNIEDTHCLCPRRHFFFFAYGLRLGFELVFFSAYGLRLGFEVSVLEMAEVPKAYLSLAWK